ncbi:MAG: hypothetical protein JKX69_05895 [Rhodobacteraceae bacterium]|nr:hypothetical protein [Paracoccaceae bacterium]
MDDFLYSGTLPALIKLLKIAALAGGAGAAILLVIALPKLGEKKHDHALVESALLMLALGVLGSAAGLAGGLSRVGVVGDIYPAALVFMGSAAAYLFGTDRTKGLLVAISAVVFSIALFIGYEEGATRRNFAEEQRALRSVCLDALTNAALVSNDAAFHRFWDRMGAVGRNGEARNLCDTFVRQWALGPA